MIINKDCLEALKELPDNSIDSIVTDPPYGLSFMGKKWDYDVPSTEIWSECLRVLKPGGYLLAFAGTRTQHRMAVRIEDAGFEIRDMIAWIYGSGFPKSLNIAKQIDKMEGVGHPKNTLISENGSMTGGNYTRNKMDVQSDLAKQWEGWGTALKPALEPITVARKPISEKTVAENVLKYGTGGINIDESRVGMSQEDKEMLDAKASTNNNGVNFDVGEGKAKGTATPANNLGRFPANLILEDCEEVRECFPETGKSTGGRIGNKGSALNMMGQDYEAGDPGYGDSGNASRFFKSIIYQAKASKSERNKGCEGLEEKIQNNTETNSRTFNDRCLTCKKKFVGSDNTICHCPPELKITDKTIYTNKNNHPTVKPIALMEYLIKMVTPKGGIVLDPFAGSGTTGIACKKLNRNFIGIERDEEYCKIAEARINNLTLN